MVVSEGCDILKAFFVLRKRPDGSLETFYNRRGNYDDEKQFLADNGFSSWADLGGDWLACQMRPKGRPVLIDSGGNSRLVDVDYSEPFDRWKFALRHLPHEIPGWVHVAEVKAECLRLLPAWAESHLVSSRSAACSKGQYIAALAGARIDQRGGRCRAYKNSIIEQRPGTFCDLLTLHDHAHGIIRTSADAFDDSTAELFYLATVRAYDRATVILHEGPDRRTGNFTAYGPGVKVFLERNGKRMKYENFRPQPEPEPFKLPAGAGVNLPFNAAVE